MVARGVFGVDAALCDIGLHADYGLYALLAAGVVKVDHAVHHAVVGNGKGSKAKLFCLCNKVVYPCGAVEQAVFGMYVKMCKAHSVFAGRAPCTSRSLISEAIAAIFLNR